MMMSSLPPAEGLLRISKLQGRCHVSPAREEEQASWQRCGEFLRDTENKRTEPSFSLSSPPMAGLRVKGRVERRGP